MLRILALILALFATPALAQFPAPSQTTNTFVWSDKTAVVPDTSGTSTTSHASLFNHLLVGEASLANPLFSSSPKSWIDNLIPNFVTGSQIGVTSTMGLGAIGAASRTSDERSALGGASGGSAGGYFFGVNDDTGAGGPIALGSNSVGVHQTGSSGITLGAQLDINSVVASACVPTPAASLCSGATTIGLLMTSGAFGSPHSPNLATQDATAAVVIQQGCSGCPKFETGIVFNATSLTAGAGPSILGVASTPAILFPQNDYIIWYNGASPSAAIFTDGAGALNLVIASNVLKMNGNSGASCAAGTVNAATFVSINGIVTHC